MNYSELENKQNLLVYIPTTKRFYPAEVLETVDNRFSICFTEAISGHTDIYFTIANQNELDNFFYVITKEASKKLTSEEIENLGEEKFKKNGKSWIF